MREVLTIRESVRRAQSEGLPVTEYSLRRWIKAGELPVRMIGKKALVFYPSLVSFITCEDGTGDNPGPPLRTAAGFGDLGDLMANRRMFSKTVTSSARFLRMPASSRLLYYDLGMEADDDGVVEAFTVMRTTGACEDDLRVLVARGFVRVLTDDLVAVICDWSVNNQIRKDRYTPSLYKPLLLGLELGNQMETVWQPNGNQMEPQYRIGKDSIDQVSVEKGSASADKPPTRHKFVRPTVEDVKAYCAEKSLAVDAERFVDFYESNGWKVGRNTMKDWKAAARNWARRDGGVKRQEPPKQADIDWSMIDYIPEEART